MTEEVRPDRGGEPQRGAGDRLELFSFIPIDIFNRLYVWVDRSLQRIAEWIAAAAEAETWEPSRQGPVAAKAAAAALKRVDSLFSESPP